MGQIVNPKKRQFTDEEKKNWIITQIAALFFIVITAVFPLYIWLYEDAASGLGRYYSITHDKTLFFLMTTGAAVILLLVMMAAVKRSMSIENYYVENEPVRLFSVAEWGLLAFIVWTFISAFVASWLHGFGDIVWWGAYNRFEGFISYACYALTFVIIARFYKPKGWHLPLVAASAVLVSLYGVLQFLGHDIFGLFPFDVFTDEAGNPLYGPISAHFRTTLGNVNIVSAYCSFAILLFAALFAVSRSKWQYIYLGAGMMSFALSLTTGTSGDAHTVAILGAMLLLVPYWVSSRERLGRILIVLSSWCIVYAGQSAYLSALKRRMEAGEFFAPFDRSFLAAYSHRNIALFIILAAVLLAGGLGLLLILKKWPERKLKTAGIIFLPVALIAGLISLEIVGSRLSDNPNNIIWQAREMMHGRLEDDFGSARGWIWTRGISVIPDNPILGTGPDTFFFALGNDLQVEAAERYGVVIDKAHNTFLQIAVCMGIPALVAYLIFLGGVFVPAAKKAFERPLLLAFGAPALSYTIQSFFCVEVPITTPLVWISLGVMAGEIWMSKIGYKQIEL